MPIRIVVTIFKSILLPFSPSIKITKMNLWDLLRGLIVVLCFLVLINVDASRVYHWIRGQAIIKLYVIYNVLEVTIMSNALGICCLFAFFVDF